MYHVRTVQNIKLYTIYECIRIQSNFCTPLFFLLRKTFLCFTILWHEMKQVKISQTSVIEELNYIEAVVALFTNSNYCDRQDKFLD